MLALTTVLPKKPVSIKLIVDALVVYVSDGQMRTTLPALLIIAGAISLLEVHLILPF
jgi:hypothetical protein